MKNFMAIDFTKISKAYLIGIKGAGMTALAEILQKRGIEVSGSDTSEKFFTDEVLQKLGIICYEGFDTANVPGDIDMVIHSTAYSSENNEEIKYVKEKGFPVYTYSEILSILFREKLGIAVCGTHGKTTVSAMLAESLRVCKLNPTALVGSKIIQWKKNALSGDGEYFVAEADEYQHKLRLYDPWSVILTSCDYDHPDTYPTFDEYKKEFKDFIKKVPYNGYAIAYGDSLDVREVIENRNVYTYGFGSNNDYQAINIFSKKMGDNSLFTNQSFQVNYRGNIIGSFEISLIGRFNILNALAVIALCHKMEVDLEKVRMALKDFQGTSRRFEYIGRYNGAILIDDYAHHPQEIRATLEGARAVFPNKFIVVVFHPHTFSRTKALLDEFVHSFIDADKVVVIDIYSSAREGEGDITSQDLVNLINKFYKKKAEYIATIEETIEYLKTFVGEKDIVISMGAGDVWRVIANLKGLLSNRPLK